MDDYAPVYLKSGSIVPIQDITNVSSTVDLNNVFNVILICFYIRFLFKYSVLH